MLPHRPLPESVVVITGASSGIGAATALALAERGTSLVLAARRPDALAEIAARCAARGAPALPVPTDVTDPAAVARLVSTAVERFGRVDGWVNNAAVALYAALADAPLAEVRRVVDVNLFGYLHGIQAVLPGMVAAGGGVVVNVASVLTDVATPFMGAYTMTKHAVRALSDTVRQEVAGTGIAVCTVLPASIDTPFYHHAANRTGRAIRPIAPVYPPELVAAAVLRVLRRPRREVYVGPLGRLLVGQWRLAPAMTERMIARYGRWAPFAPGPARSTSGNLFTGAARPAAVDGGFHGRGRTRARVAVGLGAGATAVGAAAVARRRSARQR
jgi:NADP-dependent 3-hydroxy acid dehydrogenase YdfG